MYKEPKWLPELEGTVPREAYGYATSIYSIAYEAWRRGLNVTFENIYHSKGKFVPRYTIFNKKSRIKFSHTRADKVSQEAIKICSNKQLTKEALEKEGVPVPKGVLLKKLDPEFIKNSIKELTFPLVVKPLNADGGRGVITGIDSFKELMVNIEYLKKMKYNKIIVEEYIKGEDYRAFVIGDSVVGVFRKLPPHVIGDGVKTVKQLLKEKNDIRIKIPNTFNLAVIINPEVSRELAKQNMSSNSIPKKNEYVRLKTKNNISSGGDPIDATDELPEELKSKLVEAVKSIPGLIQGGVDVMYDKETGRYAILEINTKPSIRSHIFPIQGEARAVPKAIIDYYFPETKGKYLSDTTPRYYFDYVVVKEHIINNRLKRITLPEHPYEPNLVSKTIKFQSKHDTNRIKQMVRRHFNKFKFNGEFTLLDSNKYKITLAGNYQDIGYFIDYLKTKKFINKLHTEDYTDGIRMGYTFNDNRVESTIITDELVKSIQEKDLKIDELEQEISKLKNSKSWEITAPIRKLRKKLKK